MLKMRSKLVIEEKKEYSYRNKTNEEKENIRILYKMIERGDTYAAQCDI